jgi:Tfp pilus assembly protein PilV
MMMKPSVFQPKSAGFTLLEVMVSLILGMLIVGGVMGAISMALNHHQRIQKRLFESAVLEAAAQQLLAQPQDIALGSVTLDDFPGSPQVDIQAVLVDVGEHSLASSRKNQLYRVILGYARRQVELSILVPLDEENR